MTCSHPSLDSTLSLYQSVSDVFGGDCGPTTASSAPWEKQEKSGDRKTWGRRVGSDHAREPQDTPPTRTTPSSSRGGACCTVQERNELQTFEQNQPPPPLPKAERTRRTPRPSAADLPTRSSCSRNGTRLEVLPTASPDAACSGCIGAPPQEDRVGGKVVGGGGLPNQRLSSPTRRGYSRGAKSDASATASSAGSGGRNSSGSRAKKAGHDRRRIATTPVWKRPAVPLSKPYVPVPRKERGRL